MDIKKLLLQLVKMMSEPKKCANRYKAALFCLTALTSTASFADVTGRVVGVTDGDTIAVLDSTNVLHKVRLSGIDAPEKAQPFGQKSKQSLSDCAYDKTATIQGDKLDRYGRLVGKVLVSGVDCNIRQINLGLAWHYKKYMNEQAPDDRLIYAQAEDDAHGKRTGLWGDVNPMPPWEWRRR
jgi:endonuclease YncB( thermonuclease family)